MSGRDAFAGKWKLSKSTENFEGFLEKMGVPWVGRKMAAKSTPTQEIIVEGDKFIVKTTTGFWTREASFTVGVEDIQDHNSTKMKSLVKWDGDKLLQTETPVEEGKGVAHTVLREVNDNGEFVMTMTVDDLVCVRTFQRVN